jgi:F420H(2)-dependent biliverdin reductase
VEFRLAGEPNAWLCTLRQDGSPHVTPVWFVYADETWWVGCAAHSVKVRNVVADPRVSFALEDGKAPVVAEGVARVLRGDFPAEVVTAFANKYAGWDATRGHTCTGESCAPCRRGGPDLVRVLLAVDVRRWLLAGTAQ